MRLRLAPPPTTEELLQRTPHEVVRDFPEALAIFRSHGVRLPTSGARTIAGLVEEIDGGEPARLVRDLRESLEWRRGG